MTAKLYSSEVELYQAIRVPKVFFFVLFLCIDVVGCSLRLGAHYSQ